MIGNLLASQQAAPSTSAPTSPETITVSVEDGQVLVEQGSGGKHPLVDKHCDPCGSAFQKLKDDASSGINEDLFNLAVEQTERSQRVLGTVAAPGGGVLEGLTKSGQIRAVEGEQTAQEGSAASRAKAVTTTLSREASRRSARMARNMAEARADTGAVEAGDGETSDGLTVDEHGHEIGTHRENGEDGESKSAKGKEGHTHGHGVQGADGDDLSQEELEQIQELEKRDAEVRAHEHAHKGAAGSHGGAISYTYQTGPDGKKYAIGGEVPVDISPVSGDPKATIAKMQTIRRAALAPVDPSSADRRIAAKASQMVVKAQAELMVEEKEAPKTLQGKAEESDGPQGKDTDGGAADEGAVSVLGPESAPPSESRSNSSGAEPSDKPTPIVQTATLEGDSAQAPAIQSDSYGPSGSTLGGSRRGYGTQVASTTRLNTYA